MTLGELRWISRLFNREPPWSIRALKIFESIDRDTRSSGRKLEETRLALGGPRSDTLPEPLNDFVIHLVTTVVGVLGPVVPMNIQKLS